MQGKLTYIKRFISNLSGRCRPFLELMKKRVTFKWDERCEEAFQDQKQLSKKSPILMAPITEGGLIMYTRALDHSVGALLVQKDENGHEFALYYLSLVMIGAEHNYTPVEKECPALIFKV